MKLIVDPEEKIGATKWSREDLLARLVDLAQLIEIERHLAAIRSGEAMTVQGGGFSFGPEAFADEADDRPWPSRDPYHQQAARVSLTLAAFLTGFMKTASPVCSACGMIGVSVPINPS